MHLLLLVAPGRLVRKHIAYQNIEGIAKKGKCNCGRMLKDAEGNCWHDKSGKLYPCDQDHVVPQTPSRLSRANQEVHLDSACAAQLGCLQRSDFGYYGLHLRFHEQRHVPVDHDRCYR